MTGKLPSDYTAEDGCKDNGTEKCPHCGLEYSGEGGYHATVFDQQGREYANFLDTDPGKGPFFCPECWDELETNKKASENQSLGDYA